MKADYSLEVGFKADVTSKV